MEIYEGKRHHHQQELSKCSRSPSPETRGDLSPVNGESFRPIIRTPPQNRVGPPPSPPVPTNPVAPVPADASGPLPLSPCPVCCRTFVPQSLSKHVKICEKMAAKKRKTFDSSRQRREGTDLEQYLPKNFGLPENSPFLEKSPPCTAKPTPKPKPVSIKTAITKPTADLQRCPHCNRTFGVRAFERHVEWCADKAKILPVVQTQPPPHIADAKQRLNARTQYKAPLVRGRRSSQSRDKNSTSRSASVESSRGVSPPPREYGDYKHGRTRASESMSSNDHDESPHVPVIRTSRNSQGSSCGDANVRARQARLARDLSSNRKPQDPTPDSVKQITTIPNAKKEAQLKQKERMSVKKKQQLKKLEEIANKYNERNKKIVEEAAKKPKRGLVDKSLIPVAKKKMEKELVQDLQTALTDSISSSHKDTDDIDVNSKKKEVKKLDLARPNPIKKLANANISKNYKFESGEKAMKCKNQMHKEAVAIDKQSTMSLDSLEGDRCATSAKGKKTDKTCQSIGTNTELLCPSVPCVIHDNPDNIKIILKKKYCKDKSSSQGVDDYETEPKVELLYKNLNIISSCDIQSRENEQDSKESLLNSNYDAFTEVLTSVPCDSKTNTCGYSDVTVKAYDSSIDVSYSNNEDETAMPLTIDSVSNNINEKPDDLSAERFEENYERDVSAETLYEIEDPSDENVKEKSEIIISRHGSGDTYTKFTEDPDDLQEFMNLTDKMLNSNNSEFEQNVNNFHTPNTNSLETITQEPAPDSIESNAEIPRTFSDNFAELKNNLKLLLNEAGDDIQNIGNDSNGQDESEENRKVSDMEHITVYELKFFQQNPVPKMTPIKETPSGFKLPSINETNKAEGKSTCSKKRMQRIYKSNRRYKMLSEQDKSEKEYQTFIVKNNQEDSDCQSISGEGPPLKLPRIDNKRRDETYDPFALAARQMKELMSSDTNIPKKVQNSYKDPNRTLPILRNAKDKPSLSYLRTDNTKMMKDSLNKTYQKTPTLQRMKSFGSSTNDNHNNTFGGRCSSFRINRNDKKSSQKLNSTFTKSSKENISTTEKNYFNRNSALNRSFSSYTTSSHSTPKPKDKIPKIATSMYHSFQRTTIKQPVKLDKIKTSDNNKVFVNLDSILIDDDNSSMTDSNYIDPRLINEHDNLPINVNTIRNNPDIISSMESLLTTENLPTKFDTLNGNFELSEEIKEINLKNGKIESNNNINDKLITPTIDDLSAQYDKIMSSLEQSIASKNSVRDDDSLCEDFDIEEFMLNFDDEVNKQKIENKRSCSSTTRVLSTRPADLADSNIMSELNNISSSPKITSNGNTIVHPITKSDSLTFSSNNVVGDNLFPSPMKRSTSLLDSIQKKNVTRVENSKGRNKADQLEQDLMRSLKDFDKFYESERAENSHGNKDKTINSSLHNGTTRRVKTEKRVKKESAPNDSYVPNGKQSSDSAYSSLNRVSPSKLSICNSKESEIASLEQIPAGTGSDSSGCQKDEIRSVSSDEFLAMERSTELDEPLQVEVHTPYRELDQVPEKRASSRRSPAPSVGPTPAAAPWRRELSSSGSEASVRPPPPPPPRRPRFCHECGSKFPVDTAKFCIECGVKRLVV